MYPIDFFWRAAARQPKHIALISAERSISYADLAAEVRRRAAALRALDSEPYSFVCVGGGNSVDHLITILATLAAEKIWVPLNPRNGDPELIRIIEFVSPALAIVDADLMPRLSTAATRCILFEDLARAGADAAPLAVQAAARPLNSTQAVKFTGGTTGIPKGVQQPLRAWNTNIVTQLHHLRLGPDDRYLVAAPLTHGTSTYMLPILAAGGALIFPSDSKPDALLDAAEVHRATLVFAPPTLIKALVEAQAASPRTLALRHLIYGGAPMRAEQIAHARAVFGPVLCASYGQTEAPQIAAFLGPDEFTAERQLSTGRPTLLTDIAILDEKGDPLPANQQGEIALRGDLVMTGYLNQPAESESVLVNGWLRTGDLGLIDDDGYLFIRDRLRELIITGGFNVFPSDVEAALGAHPDVIDCAVVGIPDVKWGEAVHAAIQPRDPATFDARDVLRTVRDQLGPVKTPKELHLFEQLPRTPVGKIKKTGIREEIERRLGERETPHA